MLCQITYMYFFSSLFFLLITVENTTQAQHPAGNINTNDSYYIATSKCTEYAEARYVVRTIPPYIHSQAPTTKKILDCVSTEPLISSGLPALPKEFPHTAAIGYDSDDPARAVWACGGSLISERFILSGASCMSQQEKPAKWARLGALSLQNAEHDQHAMNYRIIERIAHPNFSTSFRYNDIALFKLNDSVKFNGFIRPICLYSSISKDASSFSRAFITGWGEECAGCAESDTLLKAAVNLMDDAQCSKFYPPERDLPHGYDANTLICAVDKKGSADTCSGDGGGPLQVPIPEFSCMYHQIGITSFGRPICGQKDVPSVYTKIAPYIPWIQPIVWPTGSI